MLPNYENLTEKNVNPQILKQKLFNGVDGPNLNLPAVYALFQREDCPAFKIGHKWFCPTHLWIEWWEGQAKNKNQLF